MKAVQNGIRILLQTGIQYGLLYLLVICVPHYAHSQIGGLHSFEFLNTPSSARLAAMGGVNVSLADRDVNFFYSNPALNGDTLAGMASASYQFLMADIGYAAITYAHPFERAGMFTLGIQHMDYGNISGYDQNGTETSEFSAGETAVSVGKSHQIGNYRLGATLKGVFSNIAAYRTTAVALDLGALFVHPDQQFTIGLALRNMGFVLADYTATSNSSLPFDVQVGTTFKPQHMPLRFSVSAFNLTKADVTYNDPATQEAGTPALQQILSHFNFAAELLIHKNVNILAGYNYFNHQALKFDNAGGGAGISLGFSATMRNFDFAFSRMSYAAGKAAWSFTLSGNIRKMIKRL